VQVGRLRLGQLLGEIARLARRQALRKRLQHRACGSLGAVAIQLRVARDEIDEVAHVATAVRWGQVTIVIIRWNRSRGGVLQ
jgi:hypothetical protein